ncbi:M28 family metallopeptidase [Lysobacter fragariae]
MTRSNLGLRSALALACLSALAACDPPVAQSAAPAAATTAAATTPTNAAATQWLDSVKAISEADGEGRRAAIGQSLDTMGISWRQEPFDIDGSHGTNLLADVSGATNQPQLLIGAHSDRVEKGKGATDNASGSATVLALAQRFKLHPLANHRVAIAFWDLEEKGLLGSKAHVAADAKGASKPALYVNFDVFGWGDTLWLMSPDADSALVRASNAAASKNGLKLSAGEHYPPTDHLAFLKAGWPAVSYSLVGGDEVALVLDAYAGKQLSVVPKVMQVIHSDGDTLAQLDANAAARGVDAVEAALRQWDAGSQSDTHGSN